MGERMKWTHFKPSTTSDIKPKRTRRSKRKIRTTRSKASYGSRTPPRWRAVYVVRSSQIVKVGITSNLDRRLEEHRMQGLSKVVYVLHHPEPDTVRAVENRWKRFVQANPQLHISREELPDGYTEALIIVPGVQAFIDDLMRSTGAAD